MAWQAMRETGSTSQGHPVGRLAGHRTLRPRKTGNEGSVPDHSETHLLRAGDRCLGTRSYESCHRRSDTTPDESG